MGDHDSWTSKDAPRKRGGYTVREDAFESWSAIYKYPGRNYPYLLIFPFGRV
jgi:hypothetical protein